MHQLAFESSNEDKMIRSNFFKFLFVALGLVVVSSFPCFIQAQNPKTISDLGLTPSEVARSRGYEVENYYVQVAPGYKLDVMRIINPAINTTTRRGAVLFVHGILSDCGLFLVNSYGGTPQDYSQYDPSTMTEAELNTLLGSDLSATSMPLLLSNFNFDVVCMNRRPAPTSLNASGHPELLAQQKSGAVIAKTLETLLLPVAELTNGPLARTLGSVAQPITTSVIEGAIDALVKFMLPKTPAPTSPGYFDFNVDDESGNDFPIVVDFVLQKTGFDKLVVIGHSLGAAIIPLGFASNAPLNDKASAAILWAPAVYNDYGETPYLFNVTISYQEALKLYTGPLFPYPLTVFLQDGAAEICQFSIIETSVCNSVIELLFGKGANQLRFNPGYFENAADPAGVEEILQLTQAFEFGEFHFFDFGNDEQNLAHYGQKTPPLYPLGNITNENIVVFEGNEDTLVSKEVVEHFIDQLKVKVDYRLLSEGQFNHIGYLFHERVLDDVNIPTLIVAAKASSS